MPKAIDHPAVREQVRLLYIANGGNLTLAAQTANIPVDRAEKWKERGHWDNPQPESKQMIVSETVGRVADSLATELSEHERETRLSLARYASKCSESAAASPNLEQAPLVHKVAQIAGLTHRWAEQTSGNQFSLNVLNVESFNVQINE